MSDERDLADRHDPECGERIGEDDVAPCIQARVSIRLPGGTLAQFTYASEGIGSCRLALVDAEIRAIGHIIGAADVRLLGGLIEAGPPSLDSYHWRQAVTPLAPEATGASADE